MIHRFFAALASLLIAGCIAAPAALAAEGTGNASTSPAKSAVEMLMAVQSIRIGMNSTTVTVQNGAKAHPIVIEYGDALKSGELHVNNDGTTSRMVHGNAAVSSPLPKSLSVGQIAAWLLGLTLVSKVVGIARQVVGHR